MKSVLLIAYHFPPVKVSSGLQRTLSFAKDLVNQGWHAEVLSAHPRAYEATSDDQLKDIPESVNVIRAFSLDTAKHLSIRNRYPDFLALPDRWITWWIGGVSSGLLAIRRTRPSVIWSTYPIATAHLIALTLHKLTGIPWIADFRDSMTEDNYPSAPLRRKVFLWIEKHTVKACSKAVFTTPGAVRMYRDRYPEIPEDRWVLIPNGYNDAIFVEVENELLVEKPTVNKNRLSIVHSGVVYPSERDPSHLFAAIAELKKRNEISSSTVKIVMRATGHDSIFQPMIDALEINDIVELAPGLPYREALKEMLLSDGLLILQASNCNHQIPAKLYEYFRARKTIFALTDIAGDTARSMIDAGIDNIAPLDDANEIIGELLRFIQEIKSGEVNIASEAAIKNSSRENSAVLLRELLEVA
jgi:hypothetical protein